MSKHTPGPWRWWTSCSFRRLSSDATGKNGDVCYGAMHADGVTDICFPNGGADGPDARLIAASPDLLQALRSTRLALLMMLSYHGQGSADYADAAQHRAGEAIDEASAAITKATGADA